MTPALTDADRKAIASRLVGIAAVLEPPDRTPLVDVFTSFVVEVADHWVLVTAGHVLNKLQRLVADAGVRLQLVDGFGQERRAAEWSIPFDLLSARREQNEDDVEGIDVAVVCVHPAVKTLLEAHGTAAFRPFEWQPRIANLDSIFVAGLPTRLIDVPDDEHPSTFSAQPVFVPVAPCPAPDHMRKPALRFYGRILSLLRTEDGVDLETIDGVSGGPIVGIEERTNGNRYFLLGVQSAWDKALRVVAGNFALPVAQGVERDLRAA
jgi:hypothetical protein